MRERARMDDRPLHPQRRSYLERLLRPRQTRPVPRTTHAHRGRIWWIGTPQGVTHVPGLFCYLSPRPLILRGKNEPLRDPIARRRTRSPNSKAHVPLGATTTRTPMRSVTVLRSRSSAAGFAIRSSGSYTKHTSVRQSGCAWYLTISIRS